MDVSQTEMFRPASVRRDRAPLRAEALVSRCRKTDRRIWPKMVPSANELLHAKLPQQCRVRETYYSPFESAAVSFIDARHIGDVAAKILTTDDQDRKVYTLPGPKAITNADVAQQLTLAAGKRVTCSPATFERTRQTLIDYGVPPIRNGRTPQQNCGRLCRQCFTRHRTATRPDAKGFRPVCQRLWRCVPRSQNRSQASGQISRCSVSKDAILTICEIKIPILGTLDASFR